MRIQVRRRLPLFPVASFPVAEDSHLIMLSLRFFFLTLPDFVIAENLLRIINRRMGWDESKPRDEPAELESIVTKAMPVIEHAFMRLERAVESDHKGATWLLAWEYLVRSMFPLASGSTTRFHRVFGWAAKLCSFSGVVRSLTSFVP
jgi:hypothetical protein